MKWVECKNTASKLYDISDMKNIASATTKERFPFFPQLLLTFDIFYIPHVHLATNHGATIHEETAESLSEATRLIRPQKQ